MKNVRQEQTFFNWWPLLWWPSLAFIIDWRVVMEIRLRKKGMHKNLIRGKITFVKMWEVGVNFVWILQIPIRQTIFLYSAAQKPAKNPWRFLQASARQKPVSKRLAHFSFFFFFTPLYSPLCFASFYAMLCYAVLCYAMEAPIRGRLFWGTT